MPRYIGRISSLGVVLILFAADALGAAPRAAFIDFDRTPLSGALEAKLLTAPGFEWVERSHLELITDELKLQAAFTPEGTTARRDLAQLVQADVLVLIRKRKPTPAQFGRGQLGLPQPASPQSPASQSNGPQSAAPRTTAPRFGPPKPAGPPPGSPPATYDLVVCEAGRGLRLASMVLNDVPGTPIDPAPLADTILRRMSHAAQPIRQIFTVPPLVSRDVTFRYGYLQSAYAAVVIERLLEQPGVAVVETAEASAILSERAIAPFTGQAPATATQPAAVAPAELPDPVFITGEFRHPDETDYKRVVIRLTARRGEAIVGQAFDRELTDQNVYNELVGWADSLSTAVAGLTPQPLDRAAEAKRIAASARDLATWDNPHEAYAVAEAGLLINPDDVELHGLAFDAGVELYEALFRIPDDIGMGPAREMMRRLYEHLELQVRLGKKSKFTSRPPAWQRTRFGSLRASLIRDNRPDRMQALKPLLDEEESALLRLFRIALTCDAIYDAHYFLSAYVAQLPADRRDVEIMTLISEYPPGEETGRLAVKAIGDPYARVGSDVEPQLTMLRELQKRTDRPEWLVLAKRSEESALKRQAAENKAKGAADPARFDLFAPSAPFPPIEWKVVRRGPTGERTEPLTPDKAQLSFLRLGPGLDAAHNLNELFLIRRPGVLEPVHLGNSYIFFRQNAFVYDGQYLWLVEGSTERRPIVVDPQTGRYWRSSTAALGLPTPPAHYQTRSRGNELLLTPIAPGEVFAVAGYGRKLLATIRFAPDKPDRFQLSPLFECSDPPEPRTEQAWRNPKATFTATHVTAVHTTKGLRVLIGRNSDDTDQRNHPILVDPATKSVEVFEERFYPWGGIRRVVGDDLYFVTFGNVYGEPHRYVRFNLLSRKTEVLDADAPGGHVFFRNDDVYVLGNGWSRKRPGGKFEPLVPAGPWQNIAADNTQMKQNVEGILVAPPPQGPYEFSGVFETGHHGLIAVVLERISPSERRAYSLQIPFK